MSCALCTALFWLNHILSENYDAIWEGDSKYMVWRAQWEL